ncbi:MAG TPA: PilZ domain-containing protein [Bryobacteraceae bacterium]
MSANSTTGQTETGHAEAPARRERRRDRRYAIQSDLEYSLMRRGRVVAAGRGQSIDISSGGMLFEASEPLPLGFSIAVVLPWPARFSQTLALELEVSGRIVRSEGNRIAIQIVHHEFCRKRVRSRVASAE